MAETCIVCLGDLRLSTTDDPPPEAAEVAADEASKGEHAKTRSTRASAKSIETDEEAIAHLLPCKHDLHNACLKPWVERANSCPICRATFNMVELSRTVGGAVLDSYAVQDRVQEAELDPTMIVEDELFAVEAWEPCMECGATDDTHEMMYCDGCDKAIHIFCAGYDELPEVWYCRGCLADLEADTGLAGMTAAIRPRPRPRAPAARTRPIRRHNDAIWARVWQEVSRRLDFDLDFPFDEEVVEQRTPAQQRELAQWRRRLEVAGQQGATSRLRNIAAARLQPTQPQAPPPEPESQEELRAWNAFDKARESQEAPATVRRRKRKATASPASPAEPDNAQQPQLKRPRLRRPPAALEQHQGGESSNNAAQRPDDRSTFLSSLLKDVETKPVSASSPGTSEQHNGQYSPRDSSPMRSPTSSGHATPRALSPTPPPHRPLSPPLSSTVVPLSSPLPVHATFSPFSPANNDLDSDHVNSLHHRGRRRSSHHDSEDAPPRDRNSSASPSRTLSYSAKEEIQRMVKLSLRPRYNDKEINKDQYTEINRDVSRKMYELVGDASALADQEEREKWQDVADGEVKKAIAALHFGEG